MFYFFDNLALADDVQHKIYNLRGSGKSYLPVVGGIGSGFIINSFGRKKLQEISVLGGFSSFLLLDTRFKSEKKVFDVLGSDGCAFFCLCWILSRVGYTVDFYDLYKKQFALGNMDSSCKILWWKKFLDSVTSGVYEWSYTLGSWFQQNSSSHDFAVVEWFDSDRNAIHFTAKELYRRGEILEDRTFNSWVDSLTMKNGEIRSYRYFNFDPVGGKSGQ